MKLLYSTDNEAPNRGFRRWREFVSENISPADYFAASEASFKGEVEIARAANLDFIRLSNSGGKSISSAKDARSGVDTDKLFVSIQLSGFSFCSQDDRSSARAPGEFVVIERRSSVIETKKDNKSLTIALPRDRIEKFLGPTRRYTSLTIGRNLASAVLATNFLKDLASVSDRLSSEAAGRMAAIGIDLIVASIAERLALEAPKSLNSTIIVQRAKAHVEAHLDDPSLDPPYLAATLGVSLRRLQQLFHEHGRSISEWIWRRRLEVATERLADPGYAHLSIGQLAYGCGFLNQAHFTRRFKEHHGLTPRDFRWRALVAPK